MTKVDYTSTPTVTTSTGTVYSGSTVIVTVPLGVLKAGSITFTPSLSGTNQQKAINNAGMGLLNHVYLKFPPGTLSSAGLSGYDVLYKVPNAFPTESPTASPTSSPPRAGRGFDEISLWKNIRGVDVVGGEASGSFGAYIESIGATAAASLLLAELQSVWTKKGLGTIPTPLAVKASAWNNDPYSKGSYSYMPVNANPSNTYTYFQTAISSKLYFAGEHTDTNYPATVQGAYASGIRVATTINNGG